MTLRTYTVYLMSKGVQSKGTVSAKDAKEAMNNAKSKWKYTGYTPIAVSLNT